MGKKKAYEEVEVKYLPKDKDGKLIEGDEYRSAGGAGASGNLFVVAGDTFMTSEKGLERLRQDFGETFQRVVHTKASRIISKSEARRKKIQKGRGLHTK